MTHKFKWIESEDGYSRLIKESGSMIWINSTCNLFVCYNYAHEWKLSDLLAEGKKYFKQCCFKTEQ